MSERKIQPHYNATTGQNTHQWQQYHFKCINLPLTIQAGRPMECRGNQNLQRNSLVGTGFLERNRSRSFRRGRVMFLVSGKRIENSTALQRYNTAKHKVSSSSITLNALTYSLFTVVTDHQLECWTNHNLQRNSLIRVRFVASQFTFQVSAHGKGGCSVVWKKDRKIEVSKRT